MSGSPLFSVVVPWHGNLEHLTRAIGSLRDQSFANFEIVVVCNGKGIDVMAETMNGGEFTDCRFVGDPVPNAPRARNIGIDAAHGEWVAFLDVDDRFMPNKLELMVNAIKGCDAQVFFSRGFRVRSETLKPVYPPQLLMHDEDPGGFFFSRGANLSSSSIVVKKDLAQKVRWTETLRSYQDPDFVIRCFAAGARLKMLEQPLYEWFDDTDIGRISRGNAHNERRAWAENLRPALSDRGYFAFISRRVAQHEFPAHFWRNLKSFYLGWRLGGISFKETMQFVVRGFIPKPLAQKLIDVKTKRDSLKLE